MPGRAVTAGGPRRGRLLRARVAAVLAVVLAGAAGCGAPTAPAATTAATGTQGVRPAASAASLPAMQHTLITGATWSSTTDAAGKLLVLDVWASWCKPCKKGLPRLDRLAAASPDVAVLGLSIDEDDATMRAFLAEVPVAFPQARVPAQVVQAAPLAIQSVPAVIIVDRQGRIRWRAEDMKDGDYDAIAGVLAQLRAE